VLGVVDQDSFRVEAYLEETKLNFVRVGDPAIITPLSGAAPIRGEADSIARGIGDTQNPNCQATIIQSLRDKGTLALG
jgi:multidrug resistance efflux pump